MNGVPDPAAKSDHSGSGLASRFPDRMQPSDAVMWDVEQDPVLRSTITAVAMLDSEPDWNRFVERIERTSRLIPRMRQRVAVPPMRLGAPRWVLDDAFDLTYHVRRVRVPGPGGLREVLDLAQPIAMAPFDRARPLWEFTLVEGMHGGGAALIQKLHHSMTDGEGAVELAMLMLDSEREPSGDAPMPAAPRSGRPSSALDLARAAGTTLTGATRSIAGLPGAAAKSAVSTVRHPIDTATAVRELAVSVVKVLEPMSAPDEEVLHERTLGRRFHTIELPLADLRAAGHAAGGTVNDALLAAVIEGIRRCHALQGVEVEELRVTMPVSLRHRGDDLGGNRFAPARFTVPADIDDPIDRMQRLGRIAREWATEPALGYTDALAFVLDRLPVRMTTSILGSMLKNVDTVVTNVTGLPERAYLAGAEVTKEYAFAPTSGAAVNVALLSHRDTACVGIVVDTGAVPDEQQLVRSIQDGFADVLTAPGLAITRQQDTDPGRIPPTDAEPRNGGSDAAMRSLGNGLGQSLGIGQPRGSFERMTALDSSFLYVENERAPMHIGSLTIFEGAPFFDQDGRFRLGPVRDRVSERLHLVPKLRQRVADIPFGQGRPVWVDDQAFDIANHVNVMTLASPGTRTALAELCCTLQMQVLERSHPLWELWFIDGLDDGTVALVEKVHHTMVDGISGVDVAAALFDVEQSPVPQTVPSWDPDPAPGTAQLLLDSTWERLVHPAAWWRSVRAMTPTPSATMRIAEGVLDALASQSDVLARRHSLKGAVGTRRTLGTASAPLSDVGAAAHRFDATVNDAVLAVVGGAVRALVEHRGEVVDDLELHVLVPVSIRSEDEHGALGNRVSAIFVPVPVGEASMIDRLLTVSHEMAAHKSRHQSSGIELLLEGIELIPSALLPIAARAIHHQPLVDLVVTNVPGPPFPLYFMGAEALESAPIVPLAGNLPMGVAVLSYAGTLTVSVYSDSDSCPDAPVFVDALRDGFAELVRL